MVKKKNMLKWIVEEKNTENKPIVLKFMWCTTHIHTEI